MWNNSWFLFLYEHFHSNNLYVDFIGVPICKWSNYLYKMKVIVFFQSRYLYFPHFNVTGLPVLTSDGSNKHFCLVPYLKGKVYEFSPIKYICLRLLVKNLKLTKNVLIYSYLHMDFNNKHLLNFLKNFICLYRENV